MKAEEFSAHIQALSRRILDTLSPSAPATAWELKLKLKVSQSHLQLALGMLMQEGKVRVTPADLTYRVEQCAPVATAAPTNA